MEYVNGARTFLRESGYDSCVVPPIPPVGEPVSGSGDEANAPAIRKWTFLSNHGHVLVAIAADPEGRCRDIAERVGITERAAQSIISDLVAGGYVERERVGRRNQYRINPDRPLRHQVEAPHSIGELLALVTEPGHDGA